ncbi:hypothetical protein C8J57DRAFT_1517709 [Mycena rebaudengoi]|nr:hypothetical protein C8J57DRAFT_1517709 [Mycena rebaudengoi]
MRRFSSCEIDGYRISEEPVMRRSIQRYRVWGESPRLRGSAARGSRAVRDGTRGGKRLSKAGANPTTGEPAATTSGVAGSERKAQQSWGGAIEQPLYPNARGNKMRDGGREKSGIPNETPGAPTTTADRRLTTARSTKTRTTTTPNIANTTAGTNADTDARRVTEQRPLVRAPPFAPPSPAPTTPTAPCKAAWRGRGVTSASVTGRHRTNAEMTQTGNKAAQGGGKGGQEQHPRCRRLGRIRA